MDAARPASVGEAALAQKLRAAGLRATRPRLLVLRLLGELGGHRSVDELVAACRARDTPLPRGSVYNVMGALASHGLVMVTDVGPGRALYELGERWHHHFVCRSCGAIVDVPCVIGQRPCLRPARVKGRVDEAQVIFRGHCLACTRRPGKRGAPSVRGGRSLRLGLGAPGRSPWKRHPLE